MDLNTNVLFNLIGATNPVKTYENQKKYNHTFSLASHLPSRERESSPMKTEDFKHYKVQQS